MEWHRPTSLLHLLELRERHPGAKVVVGNTELGVEVKFKHCDYPVYICPAGVKEMAEIRRTQAGVRFGASTTLSALEAECDRLAEEMPGWKIGVFLQIKEMLRWFAGKQIRNVAAIGGNIMTGSPISDLNPIFMAAGSILEIGGSKGRREVPFDENFFTGYRRNIVLPSETLVSITIPFTKENEHFVAYKQAKRRDDDIAIVNAAFKTTILENKVESLRMAFGGMAPTTKLAIRTAKALKGKLWERSLVDEACLSLVQEFSLPADVPGAMARYRQSLVLSFFFKFFLTVEQSLRGTIPRAEMSATETFTKPPLESHQLYDVREGGESGAVGQPLPHKAAKHQVAGTATYVDDMRALEGELYMGLVLSTRAHATLVRVDPTAALAMEGVTAWVDHKTVGPARNSFHTAIRKDELVFADGEVHCHGQLIGGVVAKDQATAQRAARMVVVEYADLPAIVTMEEAIEANSFHPWPQNMIECGDVDSAFASADHVVQGSIRTGLSSHEKEIRHFCFSQEPRSTSTLRPRPAWWCLGRGRRSPSLPPPRTPPSPR